MPQILAPCSESDTIAALGEALNLFGVGVAVFDADLRAQIVTRRFAEMLALPEGAAPTLRELAGMVHGFQRSKTHV